MHLDILNICFLFYTISVPSILSSVVRDPCQSKPAKPRPGGIPVVNHCIQYGGSCYDDRCDGCKKENIRNDLCGENTGVHRKCCLPGNPDIAVCELFGDPHVRTFDGYYYDVQREGQFSPVKPCDSDEWNIEVELRFPPNIASFTLIHLLMISVYDYKIEISPEMEVKLSESNGVGMAISFPYVHEHFIIEKESDDVYVFLRKQNILARFSRYVLTIYVESRWMGTLCGLCGNYNQNLWDDLDKLEGIPTVNTRCPIQGTPDTRLTCRKKLSKYKKICSGSTFHKYLSACAFDECVGGEELSNYTIQAVERNCDGRGFSKCIGYIETYSTYGNIGTKATITTTTTTLPTTRRRAGGTTERSSDFMLF